MASSARTLTPNGLFARSITAPSTGTRSSLSRRSPSSFLFAAPSSVIISRPTLTMTHDPNVRDAPRAIFVVLSAACGTADRRHDSGSRTGTASPVVSRPSWSDNLAMKAINVTELKAHLSKYLRMASRGTRIVVKDRNEPIAELGPPHGEALSWRERLAREGRLRLGTQDWGGLRISRPGRRYPGIAARSARGSG